MQRSAIKHNCQSMRFFLFSKWKTFEDTNQRSLCHLPNVLNNDTNCNSFVVYVVNRWYMALWKHQYCLALFLVECFHMFFICFRSTIFICNCIQAIMYVQRNENYRDKRFEYETNVVYSRMNMILWYDINIMNSSVKANFLIYHHLIQEQKDQSLQITCSEYLRCFVSLLTFTCEFYCILTQLRI